MTSLFIPIDTTSVPHYFGSALIMPSNYFRNKPADIQDRYPDYILLSRSVRVLGTNCSIEVTLTDEEENTCIILDENFVLLGKPLPISRISKIFFENTDQAKVTVYNTTKGTAFVPSHLINVTPKEQRSAGNPFGAALKFDDVPSELAALIKRFNILLGGFAFMKAGTLSDHVFPRNYLHTLGFFNELIREQINSNQAFSDLKMTVNYTGLFSNRDAKWSRYIKFIFNDLNNKEVQIAAQEENIVVRELYGILQLDNIPVDSIWYDLVLISQYGKQKTKSLEDLLSFLQHVNISEQKREQIALLFGLNIGYSNLRNTYKIGARQYLVKYEMLSKLDYYTVESLYQFVFNNGKRSRRFEYLDAIIDQLPKEKSDNNLQILDTIVQIAKPTTVRSALNINLETAIENFIRQLDKYSGPFFRVNADAIRKIAQENFGTEIERQFQREFEVRTEVYHRTLIENERKLLHLEAINNQLSVDLRKYQSEIQTHKISKINSEEPELFQASQEEQMLDKMEMKELKKIAKSKGWENVSKMGNTEPNKKKIIKFLLQK